MLEAAERKATQERLHVDWIHADCRDFSITKRFALIFVAANALQHLLDLESLEAFFATAHGTSFR